MKTKIVTTRRLRKSSGHSLVRRGFVLIVLALTCFALTPPALAKKKKKTTPTGVIHSPRVFVEGSNPIDLTNFTGLSLQYSSGPGEGAIMSGFDDGASVLTFYTKNGPGQPITQRMIIDENGNVGIGSANPLRLLQIGPDTNALFTLEGTDGTPNAGYVRFGDNTGWKLHFGRSRQSSGGALNTGTTGTLMTIQDNGRVGIGTNNPTQALLVVSGVVGNAQNAGRFFDGTSNALEDLNGAGHSAYSIFASARIAADSFDAISDARVKRIEGRSDAAGDLNTLMKIEVTNYKFKDTISQGNLPQKKVIGQQVEQVYPQAVNQHTDVVPDIYEKATVKDGWVQLASDLKVGERVRLIGEKDEGIHEVLEVREGAFRTAFQSATERVFVYGREVKDFRTVDYGAITMLNVSATQQIKKEKDAEIAGLKAENRALAKKLAALASQIQKVSDRVELKQPAPQVVDNHQ
jgi:hypothetical protein